MTNKDDNSCCCLDWTDEFLQKYKYSISSKASIAIGVLGAAGSVLVGLKLFVPASIVLGICNLGIFFSGVTLEQFKSHNKILEKENESLSNEKKEIIRRYTEYKFPNSASSLASVTPSSEPFVEVIDIKRNNPSIFE